MQIYIRIGYNAIHKKNVDFSFIDMMYLKEIVFFYCLKKNALNRASLKG